MAKTKVTLLGKRQQFQVSKVIGTNTIVLDFSTVENEKPEMIDIKVFRTDKLNANTLQSMGGQFPLGGAFSIYNLGERVAGDGVLSDKIHDLCMDVFNDNLELISSSNEQQ